MKDIVSREQNDAAENYKRLLAVYKDSEDLINIGAYQQGSNAEIDEALSYIHVITSYSIHYTKLYESFGSFLSDALDKVAGQEQNVQNVNDKFLVGEVSADQVMIASERNNFV